MKTNEIEAKQVVVFNDEQLSLEVNISPEEDTVWLTQFDMSLLFGVKTQAITKHIKNIYADGELEKKSVCSKMEHTASDGKNYKVMYYNLDMIISVGYRINSKKGILFRKWAASVLKEYSLKGYAINPNKVNLENQQKVIQLLKRTTDQLDSKEILDVLELYSVGLQLLDDYDHQRFSKPKGKISTYYLNYDECIDFINKMKFHHDSELFGMEREGAFKSSIGAVYQTFAGVDVYPTIEEKAAHLLYFLVKNHGFIDGNKRIAAALFVHFLNKSNRLFKEGLQIIDNKTLATLTIMLAESNPKEKNIMINLILTLII